MFAIRIPKFQQALCSCRRKRRAAIETEQIERNNRTVAFRTPLITLRILRIDPTRLKEKVGRVRFLAVSFIPLHLNKLPW